MNETRSRTSAIQQRAPAHAVGARYGNYVLFDQVGDGGFAEVFLACELGDDGEPSLVIKRLHEHLNEHKESVDMFVTEARLMAELDHDNIVRIHYLERIDDRWAIVMERVDCDSLGEIFDLAVRIGQPIPLSAGIYIAARTARALEYAHERTDPSTGGSMGIIHRDIKPDNILLSWTGDVKITDFGCAKAAIQQELTRPGVRKGTLDYMSPEQCLGRPLDSRSDVFSLGIVLYELITFTRLYGDANDARVMERIAHEVTRPPSWENEEINASLDLIALRALEKSADDRFETARDFARALEWWLDRYVPQDPKAELTAWLERHYRPYARTSERFRQSRATGSIGAMALRQSSDLADLAPVVRAPVTKPPRPTGRATNASSTVTRAHSTTGAGPRISRRMSQQERVSSGARELPGHAPALTEERFRALQSIIGRRTNLDPDGGLFIGRAREVAAIERAFDTGLQLVSVHGAAGIGKSRVALQYSRQRLEADRPSGGVWLCDASRDESPSDVCLTLCTVLGLPSTRGTADELVQRVGEAVSARGPTLLVVDGLDAAPVSPAVALESEAVQLVQARVRALNASFGVDAHNAVVICEIVTALGGNPQALEIAAARIAQGDLEREVERLRRVQPREHSGGALSRETLAAAVQWSWEQLTDDERAAFCIASIFHGGFSQEAAVAIIGHIIGRDASYTVRVLESLQQRSLLQTYEPGEHPGTIRYRIVRVAHGFARDKLIEDDLGSAAMRRHADFHLGFAERNAASCFRAGGIEALRDVRLELPNISAIQHRALRVQPPTAKSASRALRAALAMEPIAVLRRRYDQHAKLLDKAIQSAERVEVEPKLLALALTARVRASLAMGGTRDDERLLEAARLLAEADSDVRLMGEVETTWGQMHKHRLRLSPARDRYRHAVQLLDGTGAARGLALAYVGLGETSQLLAHFETAESCLVAARKLLAESGFQHTEAVATAALGRVRLDLDMPEKAGDDLRWAQRVFRAFNDQHGEAVALIDLGRLARQQGEFEVASRHFVRAAEIAGLVGDDKLDAQARQELESVRS